MRGVRHTARFLARFAWAIAIVASAQVPAACTAPTDAMADTATAHLVDGETYVPFTFGQCDGTAERPDCIETIDTTLSADATLVSIFAIAEIPAKRANEIAFRVELIEDGALVAAWDVRRDRLSLATPGTWERVSFPRTAQTTTRRAHLRIRGIAPGTHVQGQWSHRPMR
jgi:hypothetical protein